jgi:hypothetical protein
LCFAHLQLKPVRALRKLKLRPMCLGSVSSSNLCGHSVTLGRA